MRPKREISKPKRYQTTESEDDTENYDHIEKYELTTNEIEDKIENDIQSLGTMFVETQQILQNKDSDNTLPVSKCNEVSKPCVRSDIILDPSQKYHFKASSNYYNDSQINSSKTCDVLPQYYLPNNDNVTLPATSNIQCDTRNLKLPSNYKPKIRTEDKIESTVNKHYHNMQNVCNQHYDNLNDTRTEIEPKRNVQIGPEQLHSPSSYCQLQTNVHLQDITNIGTTRNLDNSNYYTNENVKKRTKIEVLNDTHSAVHTTVQKKDIGFASPVAEDFRRLYEWMVIKFKTLEETILKSQMVHKTKPCSKPSFLPFTSKEEVVQFDKAEEVTYIEVVNYLEFVGGFSLKEALNLCMKETVQDDVMTYFTFYGNEEEGIHSFFKTKLCSAIQEAIWGNKHFQTPNSAEFRQDMIEAIRNAKQRKRNAMNKRISKRKRHVQEEEMQQIFEQRQQKNARK